MGVGLGESGTLAGFENFAGERAKEAQARVKKTGLVGLQVFENGSAENKVKPHRLDGGRAGLLQELRVSFLAHTVREVMAKLVEGFLA
jgi:hypothetical protein